MHMRYELCYRKRLCVKKIDMGTWVAINIEMNQCSKEKRLQVTFHLILRYLFIYLCMLFIYNGNVLPKMRANAYNNNAYT